VNRSHPVVRSLGTLQPWEALVVDSVGSVIEFWGFKRNQGRVWALLYLRGHVLSATQLQDSLGLSKGAVSMVMQELERWSVVRRIRGPADRVWHYAAQTDFMSMIRRVLQDREMPLIARVRHDLEGARRLARTSGTVPPEVLARLARLETFATLADKAVSTFSRTAMLDVTGVAAILSERFGRRKSA